MSAAAGVLVLTLGGGDRPAPGPELIPDASFTPSDVVPEASVPQPTVRGQRSGDRVTFSWRVVGGVKEGDTWLWSRADTSESDRGAAQELTFAEPGRVCVLVQLIRRREPPASTQQCVA